MENLSFKLKQYIENSEKEILKEEGISGVEIYKLKKENYFFIKKEYVEEILKKLETFQIKNI